MLARLWVKIAIGVVVVVVLAPIAGCVAFNVAGANAASKAAAQTEWIRSHAIPGVARTALYDMLKSQGLVANNAAYVRGTIVDSHCEFVDQSGANWPYRNEPLPKDVGPCANLRSKKPVLEPDAFVTIAGGFNLVCNSWTTVEITFDDADRIKDVNIGRPEPSCL